MDIYSLSCKVTDTAVPSLLFTSTIQRPEYSCQAAALFGYRETHSHQDFFSFSCGTEYRERKGVTLKNNLHDSVLVGVLGYQMFLSIPCPETHTTIHNGPTKSRDHDEIDALEINFAGKVLVG